MSTLSPTGPAGFGVIAERFRRAGQAEKAVALCREGLETFPEHLSARVTLGWSLLDLGEYQEAFGELKAVLKRAPDNLAAIRGLAELHERGVSLDHESFAAMEADQDLDPLLEPIAPEPMPVPESFAADPEVAADPIAGLDEALDPVVAGDLDPYFEPPPTPECRALSIEEAMADGASGGDFDLADIADFFTDDLDPVVDPVVEPVGEPVVEVSVRETSPLEEVPERLEAPISLFERAPLALRDEFDEARVDHLHAWLDRVRERRTAVVAQYDMAG